MLSIVLLFSFAVATSLLWLSGFAFYVYAHVGFSNLFGLTVTEITTLTASAFLPVFAFWLLIALIHNVLILKRHEHTLDMLLAQTRRSADHAEVMVRTLMETQVQSHSALTLNNVPLFINELNDLLCDIVIRFGLVPAAHTETIWQRVGDGNRWAFCKVVLQHAENSSTFTQNLTEQLRRDPVLAHLISQFCYRFEQMFTMLDRHDAEHYVTKIFEEGAMGRVYQQFLDACRALERADDVSAAAPVAGLREEEPPINEEDEEPLPQTLTAPPTETEKPAAAPEPAAAPAQTAPATPFGFLRPTR